MSTRRVRIISFNMNFSVEHCSSCNAIKYHTYFCQFKMSSMTSCNCNNNIHTFNCNADNVLPNQCNVFESAPIKDLCDLNDLPMTESFMIHEMSNLPESFMIHEMSNLPELSDSLFEKLSDSMIDNFVKINTDIESWIII
jgi:hypothetical protein